MNNFERIKNMTLDEMIEERIKYDYITDRFYTDVGWYSFKAQALCAERWWLLREDKNG